MYMNILEAKVITPVSIKNTVTIPHEIMMALGLHPRDRVLFELVNGQVRLRSAARVNLVDYISEEQTQRSDSLRLPTGYVLEYQVQKVIRKMASSSRDKSLAL